MPASRATSRRFGALAFVLAACTVACSQSPTAPSTPAAPARTIQQVTYQVSVPSLDIQHALEAQYPNGAELPPATAQSQWDYRSVYGCPNAWLTQADLTSLVRNCSLAHYIGTGIVVAPSAVASQEQFTAADWPNGPGLDPAVDYRWLARFVFVAPI